MLKIPRWKVFSIISVCLLGILFSMPNIVSDKTRQAFPEWLQNKVSLGLELQGGSHLQLEVDLESVKVEQLNSLKDSVRQVFRREKIRYSNLKVNPEGSVTFELRDEKARPIALKVIRDIDSTLQIKELEDNSVKLSYSAAEQEKRRRNVISRSIEVVRSRVDETGTKEPTIISQGENRIVLQLPGIDDPKRVINLLGQTAKLTFHSVDNSVSQVRVNSEGKPIGRPPVGVLFLPEYRKNKEGEDVLRGYVAVKKRVVVSGDQLVDARATSSDDGPAVSLEFNSEGGKRFAKMSMENLHKQFAIVLDGKVISAPVFRSVIPSGNGQITGLTMVEAQELSLLLRSGALPAPLKVIEERTVGPSLGADSIDAGKKATVLAIILVAAFMILAYSLFGVFATTAVVFNIVFTFAALAMLQATLTLPGIAGIALTIGMAVDANVLIYERIKEEIRSGLKIVAAVDAGYQRAMTTIVDSNITTLLGAAVLFEFGTGPIRGFAVTLSLGIIISMFTAISLTRLIAVTWLRRNQNRTKLPI